MLGMSRTYRYAVGARYTSAFIKSVGIFSIDSLCRTLLGAQSCTAQLRRVLGFSGMFRLPDRDCFPEVKAVFLLSIQRPIK